MAEERERKTCQDKDHDDSDWLRVASWAALANLGGGVLFVTALRLAQVGKETIQKERRRRPDSPRSEESQEARSAVFSPDLSRTTSA